MLDMQEHRDLLRLSRAHRASKTTDADFKTFTDSEELLGGRG